MVNLEEYELEELEDLKCEDRYIYENRICVPRVTEIISKCIHEDSLMIWSNSMGFKHKKYKDILAYAAEYGTKVHYGIECYLMNKSIPEDTPMNSLNAFIQWWNTINNGNQISILGQEHKLICRFYGGTYDLLLKINDRIFLVDFKTSNHVTYKYYLQLAAYRKILREVENINIDGTIILQLSKSYVSYKEYVLDFQNKSHLNYINIAERTFESMVYTYYHLNTLEKRFSNELL